MLKHQGGWQVSHYYDEYDVHCDKDSYNNDELNRDLQILGNTSLSTPS